MQINFFLLLQAFNQGQIDLKHFQFMLSILKAMKANLGKTGSLVEEPEPTSQKRDAGRPHRAQEDEDRAAPINEPFKFSPELMAKFEEVERMDPNDPTYAARVRAAAAEGTKVLLKEQGIDLIEISRVASR